MNTIAMKRDEVIANYRNKIATRRRIKLTGEEQAFLIRQFVKDLKLLRTEVEIRKRCQEEIALLEEGYPQQTIAKNRLNQYRAAIEKAVSEGQLPLTSTNSKQYTYEKKRGTEKTGEIGYAHHHYAWLFMCYDNEIYIKFNMMNNDKSS